MELGARIAALREKAGLNQSELGRRLGVTPQAVQTWEKGGGIRPAKFDPLAKALNVSLAELLLGERVAPPSQSQRPSPETLQDAMTFLDELDDILGILPSPRPDPHRLAIAIEVISEGSIVDGKSVVVRLADRLREWEKGRRGNESGAPARAGAADGSTHGRGSRKTSTSRGG